ncbi:hypothetical protein GCM10023115_06300 [Pontixanthobacter gangjinensis]|uniref:Glycosyltransferase n=1 Tax=Pontixanthobacter gangjinensis TaxID=1028742 RepID=A0A6I4SJF4_9SPHN|nr:glycosyltransferase [Pontixanthobacter gangjinensis]MXO55879.1 glycosyltransferase [Pontixanthobacter gangjinensis]
MKISVVTNAFNQGEYLAAAAESILSQTGVEVEYLIVNPGSTDTTDLVLEQLAKIHSGRFTVLSEQDDGPADGLNKGFAKASGDWLIYLNADDVFLPDAFAQAAFEMEKYPDAGAIIGNGYITDASGNFIRRAISTQFSARKFVMGTAFALQQSTFYNAAAFRAVGGFNLANSTSWDAELLVDLDRAGYPLINAAGFWSIFRMQPNSITVSQRFADESLRTHDRYFREQIGHKITPRDRHLRKLRQVAQRFIHPYMTIARISDQLMPRKHQFREALPPDWAEDL